MRSLKLAKKTIRKFVKRFQPVRFGNHPKNLRISNPVSIRVAERIFFGDDVYIGPNSTLKIITKTGSLMRHPDNLHVEQEFAGAKILIGSRVSATGALHLAAHDLIEIGDDVMFASNVFISDAQHAYGHANFPFKYQGMFKIAPIRIGNGSWIGQNAVIMPGVTIGDLAIIGANSVVTRDIPGRCIAVGMPARVIKRWNLETQEWVSVKSGEGQQRCEKTGERI